MARKRMVTRTINATKATVMVLDGNDELTTETTVVSGVCETTDEALKAVKAVWGSREGTPVKVKGIETISALYGMTEEDFINHAKQLDKPAANHSENAD